MQNSTYNPLSIAGFDKRLIQVNAQGVMASVSVSGTTNLDFPLTDDMLITGAWVLTNGSNPGDYAIVQITDITGNIIHALSQGAIPVTPGYVLNQFITNWYVNENTDAQFDFQYPAKLLAGMNIRFIYTAVETPSSPIFVAMNYKLHEVLE
jgi:hypothetical protein